MTKKHFIAMASEFKRNRPLMDWSAWMQSIESFIVIARTTNPRFDRARFLSACGAV